MDESLSKKMERLKIQLDQVDWPSLYTFKFILPLDEGKILFIKQMFDTASEYSTKSSKKGNYIGITIKEVMISSESVLDKYIQASKIKGVITL